MYTALIVSAGSGKRMDLKYNKVFYKIKDKTIIEYSVDLFRSDNDCEEIIVVTSANDQEKMQELFPDIKIVLGGKIRQESVLNGLKEVKSDFVMIHDGARPNLKREYLFAIKESVVKHAAAILCFKAKDSVVIDKSEKVSHYLNRDNVCLIQTPQAFKTNEILKAHELAERSNKHYTDDASVYKQELDKEVYLVYGDNTNIKATTKSDLKILEVLLCLK